MVTWGWNFLVFHRQGRSQRLFRSFVLRLADSKSGGLHSWLGQIPPPPIELFPALLEPLWFWGLATVLPLLVLRLRMGLKHHACGLPLDGC